MLPMPDVRSDHARGAHQHRTTPQKESTVNADAAVRAQAERETRGQARGDDARRSSILGPFWWLAMGIRRPGTQCRPSGGGGREQKLKPGQDLPRRPSDLFCMRKKTGPSINCAEIT
jgi:hypothetical protein